MTENAVYIGSEIYRRSSFGHNHPLSYARQESVLDMCRVLGWLGEGTFIQSPKADIETLTRFHDEAYVKALREADANGIATQAHRKTYHFGTMENPLFKGVFARAATTVGGSIEAAKQALAGKVAFHPSGGTHHGLKDRAHGFCYFNDPAFAIFTLLDAGLTRILYVDIDAHHGDGVEAAFADEQRVHTLSIHEEKRWPYTGTLEDQKPGQVNISVPHGINDTEYALILSDIVLPYCKKFKPEAIVITCGVDALAADPLAKMQLSNRALWNAVLALKEQSPHTVVLGGGGYNPWTTVRCWVGLWGLLAGYELPDILPHEAQAILSKFDSDLIDEEDREDQWIYSLADTPNKGPVCREIEALINKLRP